MAANQETYELYLVIWVWFLYLLEEIVVKGSSNRDISFSSGNLLFSAKIHIFLIREVLMGASQSSLKHSRLFYWVQMLMLL